MTLRANGDANLAVLQGVLPDVRGAGRAEVSAQIGGTTGTPTLSGNALVTDGRLRSFAFPHALEAINGIVTFDASAVRLDGLRARLADGSGAVRRAARAARPGGRRLRRDPHRARPAAALSRGHALAGRRHADAAGPGRRRRCSADRCWSARRCGRRRSTAPTCSAAAAGRPSRRPRRRSPGRSRAETAVAAALRRAGGGAVDLRIENDRGPHRRQRRPQPARHLRPAAGLRPRRHRARRGDLRGPPLPHLARQPRLHQPRAASQPFFDIEAETRVRVRGAGADLPRHAARGRHDRPAAARVHLRPAAAAGRRPVAAARRHDPGRRRRGGLAALAEPARAGTAAGAGDPRAHRGAVGRGRQGGAETRSASTPSRSRPLLVDPYQQAVGLNVNPAARVTIGKRISDRVYLTYARSLSSSTRNEIILLEYDQSDTLGWVLSQNEDGTYALDVRKRVVF